MKFGSKRWSEGILMLEIKPWRSFPFCSMLFDRCLSLSSQDKLWISYIWNFKFAPSYRSIFCDARPCVDTNLKNNFELIYIISLDFKVHEYRFAFLWFTHHSYLELSGQRLRLMYSITSTIRRWHACITCYCNRDNDCSFFFIKLLLMLLSK